MRQKSQFGKFSDLAAKILSVPHAEIKAKLDAEKKEKARIKKGKLKRPE
jgi:hypothetical protein